MNEGEVAHESMGNLSSNTVRNALFTTIPPIRLSAEFLTDPILVVVLTKSFGGYDNLISLNSISYLYFDGRKSKKLVAEMK